VLHTHPSDFPTVIGKGGFKKPKKDHNREGEYMKVLFTTFDG